MSEEETLRTFLADIAAHAGLIQIAIFAATLVLFALAAALANRLFSLLEEARLLYWRSSQHLEAARGLGPGLGSGLKGAGRPGGAAQRLAAAAAVHRDKLPARRGRDLVSG